MSIKFICVKLHFPGCQGNVRVILGRAQPLSLPEVPNYVCPERIRRVSYFGPATAGDLGGQFNGILLQRVDFIKCINLPFATHFDHEVFVQPVFHCESCKLLCNHSRQLPVLTLVVRGPFAVPLYVVFSFALSSFA